MVCDGSTSDRHSRQWRDDPSRNSNQDMRCATTTSKPKNRSRVGKPVVRGVNRLLTSSTSDYRERGQVETKSREEGDGVGLYGRRTATALAPSLIDRSRRDGGILHCVLFLFRFILASVASCMVTPEVGLIDVVPSDWNFAFLFRGNLHECSWREIDRVRVLAGRASIHYDDFYRLAVVVVGDVHTAATYRGHNRGVS